MFNARSGTFETKLVVIALAMAAILFIRSCDTAPQHMIPVKIPIMSFVDHTPRVMTTTGGGDTATIYRLQHEIDSLRRVIRQLGGRTVFWTDTQLVSNHPDGMWQIAPDTIMVECDETNRSISMSVRPATRMITTTTDRRAFTTFVEAGTFYDLTVIEPRASLGAMLALSDHLSVVVAAEARLDSTLQLRAGINAALRWTF